MFKSIFSKYVTAFMLIILISFLVVLIITASAIGRFSNDSKEDFIKNSNEIARSYISSMLDSSDSSSFDSFEKSEQKNIIQMLNNVSFDTQDVSTVVVNTDGDVVFSYHYEDSEMAFEGEIPNEIIQNLNKEGSFYSKDSFGGYFAGADVLCGGSIKNGNGEVCGYVFTCSDSLMLLDLWKLMIKIVMSSILWVLFAALIAVYFISERVIAPLREISNAAKKFAKGKFDIKEKTYYKIKILKPLLPEEFKTSKHLAETAYEQIAGTVADMRDKLQERPQRYF